MRHLIAGGLVAATLIAVPAAQSAPPKVADVLRVVGDYVKDYERTLALVAEESYSQQIFTYRQTLQSEMLFMRDDQFGWVEFRDIAAVNARPVRDRQDRLLALFTKPNADRLAQAQRIVAEGARFNLNPPGVRLNRTLNLPLTALRFLRTADQYRSHFNIPPSNRSSGVLLLEFTEEHRPRLITTPDQAAATGHFEIDAASGRVLSSNLTLRSRVASATMGVKFAPYGNVGMWVPATMDEEYRGSFNGIVTGTARYSRYRQFKVETSTEIR